MDRGGYGKSGRDRDSGRSGSRQHPYSRNAQRSADEDIAMMDADGLDTPKNSIKVSGQTDVNRLAQQICSTCRSDEPPALLTIGNNSINQAVKGIAVARVELKNDGLDLSFQPAFRHVNRTKPLIAFYLSVSNAGRPSNHIQDELTVAGHSKITNIAGAIAGRVREDKHVVMTAIGVDAVTNAVLAAGNARVFLEKDSMDIKVQPEFTKLDKNGQEINALRFAILSEVI